MLVGGLGAALSAWHFHHNKDRQISLERDSMKGSYLGPQFSTFEIESELKLVGQYL